MIEIRPERPTDIDAIRRVVTAAFGPSAEAALVDRLRASGNAIVSLVATVDGVIAGHILFSPVTLDPRHPGLRGIGLAPLAVLRGYERHHLGSKLTRRGLAECAALGFDYAVVLGHTRYYPHFGFRPAARFGLDSEYDAGDAFMALELRTSALVGVGGRVRYGAEFAGV